MKKLFKMIAVLLCAVMMIEVMSCAREVESNSVSLLSIEITTEPDKTTYYEGDEFVSSGIIVNAVYSDGSKTDVTKNVKYSDFDSSKACENETVKVSYEENAVTKTAGFKVKIIGLAAIEVVTENVETTFYTSDEFTYLGLVVNAVYADGYKKPVSGWTIKEEPDLAEAGEKTVKVTWSGKNAEYTIFVEAVSVKELKVTAPSKVEYYLGDDFDSAGMKVIAVYNNGNEKDVTSSATTDFATKVKSAGTQTVTVSYTENGVTKTGSFSITVIAIALSSITVTAPSKTSYNAGDAFESTGMKVTANYNNGKAKDVTLLVTTDFETKVKTGGNQTVIVSYTENGVTKTGSFSITVTAVALDSITVTPPSKTSYCAGDSFVSTGMKVTAKYNNGETKDVTSSATTDFATKVKSAGTQTVTVSYTENGVTKTGSFSITVIAIALSSITVTAPSKTSYNAGDAFESTGMKVTANYNNGKAKDVTLLVTTDFETKVKTGGNQTVIVSYTENGVTKTGYFYIKVVTVEGFVKIEGGTVIGSATNQCWSSNYPGVFIADYTETLSSFLMCDHEVTQAEYEKYCSYSSNYTANSTFGDGDNYPVYYVSWYDTLVYCNTRSIREGLTPCYTIAGYTDPSKWGTIPIENNNNWNAAKCDMTANGYRLPTAAEWEYAARGGAKTYGTAKWKYEYAGADSTQTSAPSTDSALATVGWYTNNSSTKTNTVKGKAANALGLYDMSGNVEEWCWDFQSGLKRMVRGGSWISEACSCSVGYLIGDDPYSHIQKRGFRVVRSVSN